MLEQVIEHELFEEVYLSSASGYVDRCNSHAVAMEGNRVVISATVHQVGNGAASDKLTLQLEGSYDGQVWLVHDTGTLEFDVDGSTDVPPDNKSSTALDDVDYAYVRLSAVLTDNDSGGTLIVLFSSEIACSAQ